jgi:hypothetical protein
MYSEKRSFLPVSFFKRKGALNPLLFYKKGASILFNSARKKPLYSNISNICSSSVIFLAEFALLN